MKKQAQFYREKTEVILETLKVEENKVYFDKLESYLSLSTFFYDESKIWENIYNMALDLQEAENDGMTAEQFFGNQPKDMADQLLKNTSRAGVKDMAVLLGIIVGIFQLYHVLLRFSKTGQVMISFWQVLALLLISGLGIGLLFLMARYHIFLSKSKRFLVLGGIILYLTVFILLLIGIYSYDFQQIILLEPFASIALGLMICWVSFYCLKYINLRAFLPYLLISFLLGLGVQYQYLSVDDGIVTILREGSLWLAIIGNLYFIGKSAIMKKAN